MPRLLDPVMVRLHERSNPNTLHIVEVSTPDASQVLRRAVDQFLTDPPQLSVSPASSLAADGSGALTLASTSANLFAFTNDVPPAGADHGLLRPNPSTTLAGLFWQMDPAFTSCRLKSFTAMITGNVAAQERTLKLSLQIYRQATQHIIAAGGIPGAQVIMIPVLSSPIVVSTSSFAWPTSGDRAAAVKFSMNGLGVVLTRSAAPMPGAYDTDVANPGYLFVISADDESADNMLGWRRDNTSASLMGGVGQFFDRVYTLTNQGTVNSWTNTPGSIGVPAATLAIESYVSTSQAVYEIDLAGTPSAASTGRVVFTRGVPRGTSATLELSTAGSGGPWTAVTNGDVVTTKQATYHLRVTLDADSSGHIAPNVEAMGVEFRVPVDVSLESQVTPLTQAIDVPYLTGAIGEGTLAIMRTGQRDYHDAGTELAVSAPSSQLEVDVYLGSRHPDAVRSTWCQIDRALVSNRQPTSTAEQYTTLSFLSTIKRAIPTRQETINAVLVVSAATATQVTVTGALPDTTSSGHEYNAQNYYMRVRQSSQAGVETGYVQTIGGSTGTGHLDFGGSTGVPKLPGTLITDDTIEVHSAKYLQPVLSWIDQDPADIWWEILTVHCEVPPERIGRSGIGTTGRSGLPPTVTDRAPGDPTAQASFKVTRALQGAQQADALIAQLSFLMGGATVEIGGQIVFVQIYPLRAADGSITVGNPPVSAVFDVRTYIGLQTPSGLESRVTELACDYGVDTTATATGTPAPNTAVYVDIDALAWLDVQSVQDLANSTVPADIAGWCFNSQDGGLLLASMLCQQVVRAASTGLRVWTWGDSEPRPQLIVGDRVVIVTDQYTDYDPSGGRQIRGVYAYALVLINIEAKGTRFRGLMLGLNDAIQIRGGPGSLAAQSVVGIPLQVTVTLDTRGASSDRWNVTVYDPIGGAAITLVHTETGTVVARTGGGADPATFVGDPAGTTIQYDCTRPSGAAGSGHVALQATAANRYRGAATIDIPVIGVAAPLVLTWVPLASSDPANRFAFQLFVNDPVPQGAGSIDLAVTAQAGLVLYDFGASTGPTVGAVDPGSTHAYEGIRTAVPLTVTLTITAATRLPVSVTVPVPELSSSSGGGGGFAFTAFGGLTPNYITGAGIDMDVEFVNNGSTVSILRRLNGDVTWIDDGITLSTSDPTYLYAWPVGALTDTINNHDEMWDFVARDDTTGTLSPVQTIEVKYKYP